ncbi:hypothetical protein [Sagittula sp. SSi028]|uniref:hypothetical protein n=1 Tax=Sagittula sp. SSi028 TaxID=3400636 RepID=UPI003AF4DEB6
MPALDDVTPFSPLGDQLAYLDAFLAEDGDDPDTADDPRARALSALHEARDLLASLETEPTDTDPPTDVAARLDQIEQRLSAIEDFFG